MNNTISNLLNSYILNNNFNIEEQIKKNINKSLYNIGVILVWPKHYEFHNTIKSEINKNDYEICYETELDVTKLYITNLLREIHYKKIWWDKNILTEVDKRIKNDSKLKIFIVLGTNIYSTLKGFKKYLREKYKLDKSYFHISDPDCFKHLGLNCNCKNNCNEFLEESCKHINLLFNKNTYNFLSNAQFKKLNFYCFFDKYNKWLKTKDKNNFCIDNGGVLAAYGIRDTHDLDFLCYDDNIITNDKDFGTENKNHRNEYSILGYTIEDIINNPENHFYHFGCKFMDIKILEKFKFNRTHTIGVGHKEIRQKDINDYNLIKSIFKN